MVNASERDEHIPSRLAAGLHRDGRFHIDGKERDSGLRVGLEDNGTLWVRVDESKRAMKVAEQ